MDLGLKGKCALVTAASRGLGRASALALAAEGAKVAVAGRDAKVLDELVQELRAVGASDAMAVRMDLARHETLRPSVDAVAEKFGGLDIFSAIPAVLPRAHFSAFRARRGRRRSTKSCCLWLIFPVLCFRTCRPRAAGASCS